MYDRQKQYDAFLDFAESHGVKRVAIRMVYNLSYMPVHVDLDWQQLWEKLLYIINNPETGTIY